MSKPKRHHYIPKSYLKNFALNQDSKFFVEAKLTHEGKIKPELISTVDMCVGKNLYTIPNVEGDDKYAIERYYAKEIDEIYPDIYELLVNNEISELTEDQRRKVILTTMSLFFRTPKFLNLNAKYLDEILEYAVANHMDSNGEVKFKNDTYDLNFHISSIAEIREELAIQNKLDFLTNHMNDLHDFVEYKMQAGMMVVNITSDIDLITSDNPVIMRSHVGNEFNLFDPTNIIHIPIDNKHYLMIAPNTEGALRDQVFRAVHCDVMFALTTNLQVEQNAESWIFGKPGTVLAHIKDQAQYGEFTPENLNHVSEMEAKSKNLKKLGEMLDNFGITDQRSISFLEKLLKDPLHRDDPNLLDTHRELRKLGWIN
ncbi:DUF4238 domain-containing protein [Pedobacter nyackensis]|uniref:DUF4238 domain-containing protein n=1 Tax=Pedobacter nyackensis TaxID=475255 RepID=UPI002931F4AC|nr:DUF4238 domain-containing protein [Pedobacter nyackensis]